jgi:cytoskeletal protein CcmA (bactofilin family)
MAAVAAVVAAAGVASACGPLAPGAEELRFRSGGDLVASADIVEIPDSVAGDVMVAAGDVRFTGRAEGSVLGVGAAQSFEGSIAGSLRAAGGGISVDGRVDRNVTLLGADVVLGPGATIGSNAYLVGARLEQRGRVTGHLRVAGREVILDGPVSGDVDVVAQSLTLGPSARIDGTLTYRVREGRADVHPAAIVSGALTAIEVPGPSRAFTLLFGAARAAAFLLAGVVVLLIAPGLGRTADTLRDRPAVVVGLGLLWIVALPLITFVVAVTVLGIPLAVIMAASYLVALYLGPTVAGVWLGRAFRGREEPLVTAPVRSFLVGGPVVAVTMLLPWVGFPVRLLATAAGFGSVALSIRNHLSSSPSDVGP